jgi:hypothetical protein
MNETIAGMKKKHKGFWLAIQVTRRNRLGVPTRGRLLARGRTHRELHARLSNEPIDGLFEAYGGKPPVEAILL